MSRQTSAHGILACGPVALALLLASGPVRADPEAAKGKAKSALCEGCHGIPGYRTAFPEVYRVPKLGGQQADYIVSALQAYKAGARPHPSMRGIAATLDEQDMADLAAYYAGDKGK